MDVIYHLQRVIIFQKYLSFEEEIQIRETSLLFKQIA